MQNGSELHYTYLLSEREQSCTYVQGAELQRPWISVEPGEASPQKRMAGRPSMGSRRGGGDDDGGRKEGIRRAKLASKQSVALWRR